jgi:hypothetical protein
MRVCGKKSPFCPIFYTRYYKKKHFFTVDFDSLGICVLIFAFVCTKTALCGSFSQEKIAAGPSSKAVEELKILKGRAGNAGAAARRNKSRTRRNKSGTC